MNTLRELIEESRLTMTDFYTIQPSLYGNGITKWNVKWDRKTGVVNINFEIISNTK